MEEVGKNNQNNAGRWQFWFLVSFSLLLIVTFVYWLPLRFLHQVEAPHEEMMEMEPGAMHEAHGESLYHEEGEIREGLSVALNIIPFPLKAGDLARLDFFIREKPENIPVPAGEIEIAHTKKMHVIGARSDLNEFFHIHPDPTQVTGVMSALYEFRKPGFYKIWSETRKDGVDHVIGHPEFSVIGEGPSRESIGTFARNRIVGNYQMRFDYEEPIPAGREVDISFDAHDLAGGEVELEDYLGEKIHLTVIKDDLKTFLHLHPVRDEEHDQRSMLNSNIGFLDYLYGNRHQISNGVNPEVDNRHAQNVFRVIPEAWANGAPHALPGEDEVINFHVTFPTPGTYKLFAQFRPEGIDLPPDSALTADFLVSVKEIKGFALPEWWVYLGASLALILLLSWGVKRFL